jgi:hypothetical protein
MKTGALDQRTPGLAIGNWVRMKKTIDTRFAVSLHHDASPDTLHLTLKWQGDHDISAFDLDRLGQVLHYENETENTRWAIIKPSHLCIPETQFPCEKGQKS